MKNIKNISRRKFLGQSCAAVGYTTLFSSLISLKGMAAAAIDNSATFSVNGAYKALVCIKLSGGNDSFNMLIPKENEAYNAYATTRSNLAIDKNNLLSITPTNTGGEMYGLHPSFSEIQTLFENNKIAFVCNTGTLVEPSTKTDILAGAVKTPLGLFSHSDQQQQWQTGKPHERTNIGWGGRIADLIQTMNSNDKISMNISLRGNNVFQRGQQVTPYSIRNNGSISITGYNETNLYNEVKTQALNSMLEHDYQDLYKNTYVNTIKSSNDASADFQSTIDSLSPFITQAPLLNDLAGQLEMVAKVIASKDELDFSRQIFFVELGGWDHHDELLNSHAEKLASLNAALDYFNKVLIEIGMQNQVTTFTISDFGRTLTSNGNGTDHAWGGNMLVMGGDVNGKKLYGSYPNLTLGNENDLQDGVMIPTTSADVYMAELALWLGVSYSDLNMLFPNLSKFYDSTTNQPPLGFMNI